MEGNVLKYRLTIIYLQINSNVIVDYHEVYKKKKRKLDIYNPTENEFQSNITTVSSPPVECIQTLLTPANNDKIGLIVEPFKSRPPLLLVDEMAKPGALKQVISYIFPRSCGKHDILTIFLQILTNRSKEKIRAILHKHTAHIKGDEESTPNIRKQIVSNIKLFLVKSARGRDKHTSIQARQAIFTACTYSKSGTTRNLDKIREVIGMKKHGFYAWTVSRDKNMYTYEQIYASKRKTKRGELQKYCVL